MEPEPAAPMLSVVIPHLRGRDAFMSCLGALDRVRPEPEIVVVDNACEDGSVADAQAAFPALRVIRSEVNRGYAGGCNLGLEHVRGRWCVFLNDDAIVETGAIEALLERLEVHGPEEAPLLQPVLRSAAEPERFDYAGGAGGLIDRWGYPFALGRLFETCEIDTGQYAGTGPLAWASGCCLAGATAAFRSLGGFEESYFAHFEEIDLCWRLRRSGGRIESVPEAIVLHRGAATLPTGGRKTYLNFRNNIWTLRRNLPLSRLAVVLALRALLDTAAVVRWLLRGEVVTALAAVRGWWAGVLRRPWAVIVPPRSQQAPRTSEGVYRGCLPWAYWVRGVRSAAELLPRTRGWNTTPGRDSGQGEGA